MAELEGEWERSQDSAETREELKKEKSTTILQIAELRNEIRNQDGHEGDLMVVPEEWNTLQESFGHLESLKNWLHRVV
jgi:hypothetical protein